MAGENKIGYPLDAFDSLALPDNTYINANLLCLHHSIFEKCKIQRMPFLSILEWIETDCCLQQNRDWAIFAVA